MVFFFAEDNLKCTAHNRIGAKSLFFIIIGKNIEEMDWITVSKFVLPIQH